MPSRHLDRTLSYKVCKYNKSSAIFGEMNDDDDGAGAREWSSGREGELDQLVQPGYGHILGLHDEQLSAVLQSLLKLKGAAERWPVLVRCIEDWTEGFLAALEGNDYGRALAYMSDLHKVTLDLHESETITVEIAAADLLGSARVYSCTLVLLGQLFPKKVSAPMGLDLKSLVQALGELVEIGDMSEYPVPEWLLLTKICVAWLTTHRELVGLHELAVISEALRGRLKVLLFLGSTDLRMKATSAMVQVRKLTSALPSVLVANPPSVARHRSSMSRFSATLESSSFEMAAHIVLQSDLAYAATFRQPALPASASGPVRIQR